MNWVAIIAYLIDVFGTFLGQFSYILMKKANTKVEQSGLNGTKKKIVFFTCEWLLGFAMLTVGSIIHVAVLPFCDLVVLTTNASLGILMNNIMAVIYLNEKIVWSYDAPAITLIIGGSLTIILLSSYEETEYTPDVIKELLWSSTTLIYFLCFVGLIAATVG